MHSKTPIASLAVLALVAGTPSLRAALIASETFDTYNLSTVDAGVVTDPLQGNNGGTGFTSAWAGSGPGQVETGAAGFTGNYATVTSSIFDQYRTFSPVTSGDLWIAWKAAWGSPAGSDGSVGYGILGLFNSAGTQELVWVGDTNGQGDQLRSTVLGTGVNHFTISANTVYRFAIEISGIGAGAGLSSINIYSFDSAGDLTSLRTVTGITIAEVGRLRLWGGFASEPRFDDIYIGTTRDSVIDPSIIPEPSAYGALLGAGALGLCALRRRR